MREMGRKKGMGGRAERRGYAQCHAAIVHGASVRDVSSPLYPPCGCARAAVACPSTCARIIAAEGRQVTSAASGHLPGSVHSGQFLFW